MGMSLNYVVANVLNCDVTVSEFELQSRYCVYFWKSINHLISLPNFSYQLNSTSTVLL